MSELFWAEGHALRLGAVLEEHQDEGVHQAPRRDRGLIDDHNVAWGKDVARRIGVEFHGQDERRGAELFRRQ